MAGALQPYQGRYVNAKSASDDLDLATILAGCDAVDSEAGNITDISQNLSNAAGDLTVQTFSIDGVSVGTKAEEYCNSINDVKSWIEDGTSSIRSAAEAAYNRLQEQYNEEARQKDQAEINRRNNMKK